MSRSIALLAVALLWATGCASSRGDRLVASGDLAAAAAAYERAARGGWLTSADRSLEAMIKLGSLLATPTSPIYDPAEARRTWERVARRGSGTPWALQAKLLLDRLDADEGSRVVELEGHLARAKAELASLRARGEGADPPPAAGADADAARLAADLEESRRRVVLLEAEVRRLEAEIGQLKALDLELDEPPLR